WSGPHNERADDGRDEHQNRMHLHGEPPPASVIRVALSQIGVRSRQRERIGCQGPAKRIGETLRRAPRPFRQREDAASIRSSTRACVSGTRMVPMMTVAAAIVT